MSAPVHDSPDRAVTAIEPLTGSDNFATWKRLMTSYLKARQVWDVVSGDLQRPDCLFKYANPITADIHPLVEPHLNLMTRAAARCCPETKARTRKLMASSDCSAREMTINWPRRAW
ncbi:hypothetical protein CBS147333_9656 [Penicillium roqueforti]|nr:hypothetical protein CBS147333_9656 [Penicillium roqueforti]KAI3194105.1 hypothetical protein CBS147311_8805 [Penicillium roqueforti]KAI3261810.1 hypothetical protein CBS147308_9598 [Penicillium roqueforti]KAI3279560.1 hypothetical protein DTO003C3_9672 [Penicillium roqueforti]KAI3288389.1 hypothetical protein DTO002I6_7337 [Penicillium roqueforti]